MGWEEEVIQGWEEVVRKNTKVGMRNVYMGDRVGGPGWSKGHILGHSDECGWLQDTELPPTGCGIWLK